MKALRRVLLVLLAISLLLSGCAAGQKTEETAAPTESMQTATEESTEAPTEAPTEPAYPEGFRLDETVFPETDAATGTLKFYIKDQEIYAGGPVSSLLNAGVTTYEDFSQILQPRHISSVMRVRVELEDTNENNLPFVFFMAMNASNEPKPISECLFYSITINTDSGILFGSGNDATPFVTGETTLEELTAVYGEPDYNMSRKDAYREIAYYEPFSCAYFSFNNETVRQVTTYYSANVFGHLAEGFDYEFRDSYFGNDCYILMNQYMDVMPYLLADREETEGEAQSLPEGTGVLESLSETITMAGLELKMGMRCIEMPELFGAPLWNQMMAIHKMYYFRAGRTNLEEFYFMNLDGQTKHLTNNLVLKGVFTRNKNHANWGEDKSNYHEFSYENLTQDSTIEDILEQYGMPKKLHCTSYARACFAWLFYEDEAGNKLEICVDPILNQIMELHISKYYEGEIKYQ